LFSSGSGIARLAQEAGILPAPDHIESRAKAGDAAAIEVLRKAGSSLGVALAGFVNVLNPELLVLSGPVLKYGSFYLGPFRTSFDGGAMKVQKESVRVVVSSLEEPALLGAAVLAFSALDGE
jgi:glucokinase